MSAERPVKGLGMGLQALLGEAARTPSPDQSSDQRGVREIEIGRISPNPEQPRMQFGEEALDELADSIRERGVLQPILLRATDAGFMIIAGERRWRAAQRAQLHTIPALVRDIDEAVTAELALPIAGLMSDQPFETVTDALHHLRDAARALGCTLPEPFLQVAFLALPVIPHLKLTDRGLFDVDKFEFVA